MCLGWGRLPQTVPAFSLWDGLRQLHQPQRGVRGLELLQIIPGVTPNCGEWVRAGAEAQSCPKHLPLGIKV